VERQAVIDAPEVLRANVFSQRGTSLCACGARLVPLFVQGGEV